MKGKVLDMGTTPVFPLVLSMGLPMAFSMLITSLYNIVDSFFVARLSQDAMTSLSLVFPIQNFINAIAVGFGVGMNSAISYFVGAGKMEKACAATTSGLVLSAIHSLILTVLALSLSERFIALFTTSDEIVFLGWRYSLVAFSFTFVNVIGITFEKIFQATGRMKVTMIGMASGCIVNIILDPILIFGYGVFPKLGVEGAALATGIGQVVVLAFYIAMYLHDKSGVYIDLRHITFEYSIVKRMYSVGIPASLNIALPSFLISALNALLSSFSAVYIFILGIYYKLQTFLYLPVDGMVQGMRPIVGYNYGGGMVDRVGKTYYAVLLISLGVMALGTLSSFIFPEWMIGIFTEDENVITTGAHALRIISAGFVFSSFSVAATGAFEGLGKGLSSLLITLLRNIFMIIPLSFILSRFIGVDGVWHSFWITEVSVALFSAILVKGTLSNIHECQSVSCRRK